jgi:hypothetical protein
MSHKAWFWAFPNHTPTVNIVGSLAMSWHQLAVAAFFAGLSIMRTV